MTKVHKFGMLHVSKNIQVVVQDATIGVGPSYIEKPAQPIQQEQNDVVL